MIKRKEKTRERSEDFVRKIQRRASGPVKRLSGLICALDFRLSHPTCEAEPRLKPDSLLFIVVLT
jgi:hypothetical protein